MVPSVSTAGEAGPHHLHGAPPNSDITCPNALRTPAGAQWLNPRLQLCEPSVLVGTGNTFKRLGFSRLNAAKPAEINQTFT